MENEEKYLSLKEAADKIGLSRQRILKLVATNQLPATKIGSYWVVKESDLSLIHERKPGRPPKNKVS